MLWSQTLAKATDHDGNTGTKLGNVIYRRLQEIWSKSGISRTAAPILRHLPILSLTRVEFCHMMFHHLIPCMCKSVKNSFSGYRNKTLKKLFNTVWPTITRCQHRPTRASTTYLKNTNEGTKVTLKSVNVFTSGAETNWHGLCFGFHDKPLQLLDRIIVWVGVFFSDTLEDDDIHWLKQECFRICVDIEQTPQIWYHFDRKQCLYVWLNMVFYNIWIEELPIESFALMFEGANKQGRRMFTLNSHWYKEKLMMTYMARDRLIKDMEYHAMGIQSDKKPGSGWSKLYKEDLTHNSFVKKLLQYDMDDNGRFSINLNKQHGHFDHGFIKILKPRVISCSRWRKFYNNIGNEKSESANILKSKIPFLWQNMDIIIDYVLNGHQPWNKLQCRHLLMHALCAKVVQIFNVHGFGTLYRNFMDSHVRKNDLTWIRNKTADFIISCQQFIVIESLTKIKQFAPYINRNNITTANSFLLILGELWLPVKPQPIVFKQWKSMQQVPVIVNTNHSVCVNAEFMVQQLYVKHDHVIPSKHDMYCVSRILNAYPNVNKLHFKERRKVILDQIGRHVLPFCGMGWECQEIPPKINCMDCLLHDKHSGGKIIGYCCEKEWPFYQAFSVYQGFLNRMFNDRTINELT